MTEFEGSNALGSVREGMSVLDSDGAEVGKVEFVQMADPDATTAPQEESEPGGVPGVGGMPMATPGGVPGTGPGSVMGGVPGSAGVSNIPAGLVQPEGGDEPVLPPALSERLRRQGYLKVDSKGLFKRDVYISADQVAAVKDDVVNLAVSKDELPKES